MTSLRIAIILALTGVVWSGVQAQAPNYQITRGTVVSCRQDGGTFDLETISAAGGGTRHWHLAQSATDLPGARYAAVVGRTYDILGGCLRASTEITLHECVGCDHPLMAVELNGSFDRPGPTRSSLWMIRRFVNGTPQNVASSSVEEFISSRIIAGYNRRDESSRTLWVAGKLNRSLQGYRSVDVAAEMLRRFGRPGLLDDGKALTALYTRWNTASGLVNGLPYIPKDTGAPFVGYWGLFVRAVYVDDGHGALSAVFQEQDAGR